MARCAPTSLAITCATARAGTQEAQYSLSGAFLDSD